jgi:hypothetical protein
MTIVILTLVIGKDYRKSLQKALDSKREYAKRHGYTYIEADEERWDRNRPISWSKVPFLIEMLDKLPEGALVWQSDADVLITNLNIKLEDHVVPLLPDGKDMLLIKDACHNLNAGNLLIRNTAWSRDFWKRVNERTDCTYHIWWETLAVIRLFEENADDNQHIQVTNQHKRFNAYVMGCEGEPLWEPGDFLVHFAGVYKADKIQVLIDEIQSGKVPRLNMFSP